MTLLALHWHRRRVCHDDKSIYSIITSLDYSIVCSYCASAAGYEGRCERARQEETCLSESLFEEGSFLLLRATLY